MAIYLGLGTNLGDRRHNLRRALAALEQEGIRILRISPVVESPALLPADAEPEWNLPFLNLVAECQSDLQPAELLARLKTIERSVGREAGRRWAPRLIDIDILLYGDQVIATEHLAIPHPELARRAFVLAPLAALVPNLPIPGTGATALALNTALARRIPLWMGIINLTPDSFSDGGELASWAAIDARIDEMTGSGAQLLDFGAESTRPGATPLTADEEWARLEPILARVVDKLAGDPLRPLLSLDTYHPQVAARALELGIDIINDVGGLAEPAMLELAAGSTADFIAMHNLGLPADPGRILDPSRSAVDQVEQWLDNRMTVWTDSGIDPGRIIFDPGIGFGKNPLQSLDLLRQIDRFNGRGLRLLVGHSRKSFMKSFANNTRHERDLITIGASLALCGRGVDILRVHNLADHTLAYRGWAHLQ